MSKVSVIIPSRKERFLQPTVNDLFKNASGEIEVLVYHDGVWPEKPLEERPGLVQVHTAKHVGMRGGINALASIASGAFLMKADGHTSFGEGWDEVLKAECAEDWVMVPRRLRLDPEAWIETETHKPPIDYHYLSYPFAEPDNPACGLHGTVWNQRGKERANIFVDIEASSQGSCYFLHRKFWDRVIGPLDDQAYGVFTAEMQEVGMKAWASGGQLMVCKLTHYKHLHKGRTYGTNYGFSNSQWKWWSEQNKKGHDHTIDFWIGNKWDKRVRDFKWLVDKFGGFPGWPKDWDQVERDYQTWKQRFATTAHA